MELEAAQQPEAAQTGLHSLCSPNKESKTHEENSDHSYPQRTEAETDVWSPEFSHDHYLNQPDNDQNHD